MTDDRVCTYCGLTENLTNDHVPPKCLFLSPRPTDLITVPACKECNNAFSKDDEFFRALVAIQADAAGNRVGQRIWDEKVIASTMKRSPALKRDLAKGITTVEVRSYSGLYLGKSPALPFPKKRINRVVERIVRGLLWHHYRIKPGPAIHFQIRMDPEIGDIPFSFESHANLSSVGGTVFQYRHNTAIEDPEQSIWLLRFYSTTTFLVLLIREDSANDGRNVSSMLAQRVL